MSEITWEKVEDKPNVLAKSNGGWKFIVGGVLMLAAVVYLMISSTLGGARYFITVDEIVKNPDYLGQTVRISGAVLGDSIQYDARNLTINFTIANIPTEITNLAETLHLTVNDPNATRLAIHIENQVMPDLLQHEAQAILTGQIGSDGVFYATELLLKCPSRYDNAAPEQAVESTGA